MDGRNVRPGRPFSALPTEMQKLLSGEKHIKPDAESSSSRQPAA